MRIALMRTGTVLFADNHQASPVAGNQDALGVFRYLKQSGHDVCLFGPAPYDENGQNIYGEGWFLGVKSFGADFSATPYETTPKDEYLFRTRIAVAELRRWHPEVCVNVAGQQPSHSNPCNPWGTFPLRTAITTNFPMQLACEDLRLPRVVILNDPRNLPREHENQYMPFTLPVALLSQRSKVSNWTLKERPGWPSRTMRRTEVYAGCENWWSYGVPLAPLDTLRMGTVVMAHSHAHDLRVYGPERAKTWDKILKTGPTNAEVYGHGWAYCNACKIPKSFDTLTEVAEHRQETGHAVDVHPQWRGCIKHDQVHDVLKTCCGGPMISLEKGFATGKLREYVVAGALPRLVTGGKFTYDSDERYLPLDHPSRIVLGEPWNDMYDQAVVEELRVKTTPNFGPLEEVLEAVRTKREHTWGGFRWV